ncbi:MAG: hypothetical protein AB7G93_16250 [Bdellovibrionales bacterium]
MRIGALEVSLVVLLTAVSVYLSMRFIPGVSSSMCNPLPLSPEVKTYVDQQTTAEAKAMCGEMPKLVSRVAALEGQLNDTKRFRQLTDEIEAKRQRVEAATGSQYQEQLRILETTRQVEVNRLRSDMAAICSGVTIQSPRSPQSQGDSVKREQGSKGAKGGGEKSR